MERREKKPAVEVATRFFFFFSLRSARLHDNAPMQAREIFTKSLVDIACEEFCKSGRKEIRWFNGLVISWENIIYVN